MQLRSTPGITLRQLNHYVVAAEAGKISEAARQMHMAPSAISMSISELERIIGVQLCVKKKSKGITLTPAGRVIYDEARTVLQAVAEMPYIALEEQQTLVGPLAVGCFNPLGPSILAPMLNTFTSRHPGVDIQFVEEMSQTTLQEQVLDGVLDLAFVYGLDLAPGLEVVPISTIEPRALFAAGHPLAQQDIVTLQDLADHGFLLSGPEPVVGRVVDMFRDHGIDPQFRHRTRSYATARALVGRGSVVTVIHEDTKLDQSYEGRPITVRPIAGADQYRVNIDIIRSPGVRLNGRARAWIDLALELHHPPVAALAGVPAEIPADMTAEIPADIPA